MRFLIGINTPFLLSTFAVLVLFIIGCISNLQGDKVENTQQNPDLVFIGTVDEIENAPLDYSLANWIVTFRVEKVITGSFSGKTFSFRVHSPSQSGLTVGSMYTVAAEKTDEGYKIDQYQWRMNVSSE